MGGSSSASLTQGRSHHAPGTAPDSTGGPGGGQRSACGAPHSPACWTACRAAPPLLALHAAEKRPVGPNVGFHSGWKGNGSTGSPLHPAPGRGDSEQNMRDHHDTLFRLETEQRACAARTSTHHGPPGAQSHTPQLQREACAVLAGTLRTTLEVRPAGVRTP